MTVNEKVPPNSRSVIAMIKTRVVFNHRTASSGTAVIPDLAGAAWYGFVTVASVFVVCRCCLRDRDSERTTGSGWQSASKLVLSA